MRPEQAARLDRANSATRQRYLAVEVERALRDCLHHVNARVEPTPAPTAIPNR